MDFWLKRALEEIDRSTEGLTPEQMSWRPGEGKWSIAEVLEHLSMTYSTTILALNKRQESGQSAAGPGSLKQWFFSRVVLDLGYLPSGRQAPAFAVPKSRPQAPREVRENLVAMDKTLTELESKLGAGVKLADHFILGPFTAAEWRKFHYRHTHHHMKQVLALRQRCAARSVAAS